MEAITYEINHEVATITINRPSTLNALNWATLKELSAFLENPPEKIKALILTGSGEKAFIAGADLKEMATMSNSQIMDFCKLGQKVADLLEQSPFVTIAAVNGYALGGGLEMALACDLIYANKKAVFGFPETSLGLLPGFGGTQRLARVVGPYLAKELILSGKKLKSEEALTLNLVNRICDQDRLLTDCLEKAQEILKYPFTAITHAKTAINHSISNHLQAGLELERTLFVQCFANTESKHVIAEFINK